MRARLKYLGICFSLGLLVVLALFFTARHVNHSSNGFVRMLPSHLIKGVGFTDISDNTWQVAGINDKIIYMKNDQLPDRLFRISQNLKDTSTVFLKFQKSFEVVNGASLSVNGPYVYISDGVKPAVITGEIPGFVMNKSVQTAYFTACQPLSPHTFIFRSVINRSQNIIVKQNARDSFKYSTDLLKGQVDSIFSTDGMMTRAANSPLLFYTYYYRNQFICMDTNLNLIYTGKTIDTTTTAKITVAKLASRSQSVMASPPAYVNKTSFVTANWLFIESALRADNEVKSAFDYNSVIDLYNVADGKYRFSLYIPAFKGIKMKNFAVIGSQFYAFYDHYVYLYELAF